VFVGRGVGENVGVMFTVGKEGRLVKRKLPFDHTG